MGEKSVIELLPRGTRDWNCGSPAQLAQILESVIKLKIWSASKITPGAAVILS
jgi:hypothetical protein